MVVPVPNTEVSGDQPAKQVNWGYNLKKSVMGAALLLASVLAISAAPAQAAPSESADKRKSASAVLRTIAPEVLKDRSAPVPGQRSTNATPVIVGGSERSLAVSLPKAGGAVPNVVDEEGLSVFDHGNGSRTVPVRKSDQSVQIVTILDDASAPETYEYDLSSSGASSIENLDGQLILRSADGTMVGGIAPAWAKDAEGKSVPTSYSVQGLTVTQLVSHREARVRYPVVADPWLGVDLFEAAWYSSENGQLKVNLRKSGWGQAMHTPGNGQAIFWTAGWDEARTKVPRITEKLTLHQQYDCHVGGGFANFAGDWNLEKWRVDRTAVWSWGVAVHRCNWTTANQY